MTPVNKFVNDSYLSPDSLRAIQTMLTSANYPFIHMVDLFSHYPSVDEVREVRDAIGDENMFMVINGMFFTSVDHLVMAKMVLCR